MKSFCLILSICLLCCNAVFANVYEYPVSLESISRQTPEFESIRCKFKQEKTMPNIENPLISSGDFEFIAGEGIHFYTTNPIKTSTDYTNKNYRQINDVINAISTKKYSSLEKEFDFFYKNQIDDWHLGLKPKAGTNAKDFISSITITGSNNFIKYIEILQTNGNKTALWFYK